MSRANLVLKLRFDVEPAKVSRFDNPVIWWCVLPKTIMNSWTSKYHWSKLQSVEVRWLSTMSFSDDGKVVKVQPGTKIGTEFSNFTRRNMRDVPLRIKLLVEMLRLVVIPDYTADSTAQVCLKHSAGCGKLLCSKHFSTLIYLWEFGFFSARCTLISPRRSRTFFLVRKSLQLSHASNWNGNEEMSKRYHLWRDELPPTVSAILIYFDVFHWMEWPINPKRLLRVEDAKITCEFERPAAKMAGSKTPMEDITPTKNACKHWNILEH